MEETEESTALVERRAVSVTDLMSVAEEPVLLDADERGLGAEDLDSSGVILPRVNLLQSMSKTVTESPDDDPPKPGTYWLSPFNRPLTIQPSGGMNFVVVQIFNSQRLWTPLDEGGGLICEAVDGKLVAKEPAGLAGAKLRLIPDDGTVEKVEWEGGTPTDVCRSCVYGLGAAAAVSGRGSGKNAWLPKVIELNGVRRTIPDELRVPKCQSGIDALVLVLAPAWRDLPAEIIPAYISFTRSGFTAGRSLAGMIALAPRVPAWGKIYTLSAKKTTNDKATFFVPTIRPLGSTRAEMAAMARELYDQATQGSFRQDADFEDALAAGVLDGTPTPVIRDDEPAPDETF